MTPDVAITVVSDREPGEAESSWGFRKAPRALRGRGHTGRFGLLLVEQDRAAVEGRVEPQTRERLTSFFGGLPLPR